MADEQFNRHDCTKTMRAVHDAMDVLHGKWTISIVASLSFNKKRYSDLLREVNGISGKMLSRELKNMEMNKLVTRTVVDTQPVTVYYELTENGRKLRKVIGHLASWGNEHRKVILGK